MTDFRPESVSSERYQLPAGGAVLLAAVRDRARLDNALGSERCAVRRTGVNHATSGNDRDQVTGPGHNLICAVVSRELDGIVEVKQVTVDDDRIWILFDDADFVLRVAAAESGSLAVHWMVAVRETPPKLGTWWTSWRSRPGHTDELVAEVLRARRRIRCMLDDHSLGVKASVRRPQSLSDPATT
jgi:hypothetical protein